MDQRAGAEGGKEHVQGAWRVVKNVLVGMVHLGVGWVVASTGLVAPVWVVAMGGLLWLMAAALLWRGLARGRWWAGWLPLGLLAGWVALVSLGGVLLGWSA